jgi:hypothetical protein
MSSLNHLRRENAELVDKLEALEHALTLETLTTRRLQRVIARSFMRRFLLPVLARVRAANVKRGRVMEELIQTELAFQNHLRHVISNYLNPLSSLTSMQLLGMMQLSAADIGEGASQ